MAPPPASGLGAVAVPLTAMLASQGVIAVGSQVVPVLAPEIARVHGVDPADVGVYSAVLYSFAVASSVIGGSLVRRFGAMRTCQAALLLTAAGLACTGLGLPGLLLSAIAVGLGYGPPTPASSHLLIRVTPAHLRASVFSLKQTGVPIGGALTGVLAPFLLLHIGLDATVPVFAALCLLIALALQPWRDGLDADREPGRPIVWRDAVRSLALVLRDPPLRLMALVSIGFSAMQMALAAFYTGYLTHHAGLSLSAAGFALSTAWVSGIIGRLVWGALADGTGRPGWVLAGIGILAAVAGAGVTQISAAWPLLAVHALSAVFGAAALGWNGVWLAEVARLAPPDRVSEATGGAFFFTFGAAVLSPLAFRALTQMAGDWTVGYWAMAGFTFLCSLSLLRPVSRGTRRT